MLGGGSRSWKVIASPAILRGAARGGGRRRTGERATAAGRMTAPPAPPPTGRGRRPADLPHPPGRSRRRRRWRPSRRAKQALSIVHWAEIRADPSNDHPHDRRRRHRRRGHRQLGRAGQARGRLLGRAGVLGSRLRHACARASCSPRSGDRPMSPDARHTTRGRVASSSTAASSISARTMRPTVSTS